MMDPVSHDMTILLKGQNMADAPKKSFLVERDPQEGGMPEWKKLWLEKYADFTEPFSAYHEDDNPRGDKGVFRIADLDIREEPKYLAEGFVDKLCITCVLYDETGETPVMVKTPDGRQEKPLAIELKVTNVKNTLSWENFQKSNFFALIGELGYDILPDDRKYDLGDLIGLYLVMSVDLVPSKKNPNRKYANVAKKPAPRVPKTGHVGRELAQKFMAHNKEQLQKMFSAK